MRNVSRKFGIGVCAAFMTLGLKPALLFAQTDEIQVYDAEIEDVGKYNVMVHSNYIADGRKTPEFPGAIVPDHSVNGAVEWAYGVKDWFEQGLYFPVYTAYSDGRGGSLNGFKIRELFVKPHAADSTFFYGANFEFSFNYSYWEPKHFTSEVRPIIGLHLHPVDIIVNPIVDTDYTGFGNLEFVPAARVAYNLPRMWTVAVEEYADMGPLNGFVPASEQFQQVWAVVDHDTKFLNIEAGVGVGVTSATDKLTFKLMLSRELP